MRRRSTARTFADLDAVRELAAEVRDEVDTLDALCNNAGLTVSEYHESEQGYELTVAVNHLADNLLTHELVDLLADDGRVVTTASIAHHNGDIDFELLAEEGRTGEFGIVGRNEFAPLQKLGTATGLTELTGMAGFGAYSDSKLANVLFTRELAARFDGERTATCFHPGIVPGSGVGRDLPFPASLAWDGLELVPGITDTVEDGGAALAHLVSSEEVADVTGAYFHQTRERRPSRAARDERNADRLWAVSADLVGVGADWP